MKNDFTRSIVSIFYVFLGLALLISCGGGGGDGGGGSDGGTPVPTVTDLQGKWVYSSDNHPTGGVCGLDSSGHYGERVTITFNSNQYTYKYEGCWIPSGNTGAYIETKLVNGTFSIGEIFVESADPSYRMRAL